MVTLETRSHHPHLPLMLPSSSLQSFNLKKLFSQPGLTHDLYFLQCKLFRLTILPYAIVSYDVGLPAH